MNERNAISAFAALAQETRLRAFRALVVAGCDGLSAGALAERLDAIPATLSHHMKELEHAELVTRERRSRHIIYRADYAGANKLMRFFMEDCCAGDKRVRGATETETV